MSEYKWNQMPLAKIRDVLAGTSQHDLRGYLDELQQDPRKAVQELCRRYIKNSEKEQKERARLDSLWARELKLAQQGLQYIAGIDEAGRGPLAGPVVAAAVILPPKCDLPLLNDSKKLKPAEREKLAVLIKEKSVAWAVGVVDHLEIDEINILQATKKAMCNAVAQLTPAPEYLLIDALKLELGIPQEGIIHGDGRCASIAAASIIAKTYRDSLMDMVDMLYPNYGFKEHKGYGTARHLHALAEYGPCPVHRRTFIKGLEKHQTM